jgi:GT2 family glycosyltransferase
MKDALRIIRKAKVFDEHFYRATYEEYDPILKFVDAVSHYLAIGYVKDYKPFESFDAKAYASLHPEVVLEKQGVFLHFCIHEASKPDVQREYETKVRHKQSRGLSSPYDKLASPEFSTVAVNKTAHNRPAIDLVMPVYAGYRETLHAIHAVLSSSNKTSFQFIVIDDCSPDRKLSKELKELSRIGYFLYIRNESNLGFVKTVNTALALHEDRDVLLLNSDTLVFGDWLDRILAHAAPDVATITPFSNNATLCSYPVIFADNKISPGVPARKLDVIAARCNRGKSVDVPTGVGFCFFMSRRAIDKVGVFDASSFGAGYGEENDFCRRAAAVGLRNIHALDVFVFHKGGASFGAGADARKVKNLARLLRKHPDYSQLVRNFANADPSRFARRAIDFGRLTFRKKRRVVVCFSHTLGGGIEHYLQERARVRRSEEVLIVATPEWRGRSLRLEALGTKSDCPNLRGVSLIDGGAQLRDLLASVNIDHFEIHSLFGYHSDFLRWLPQFCRRLGRPYDFYLHDYSPICPRINLVDDSNWYCGEEGVYQCRQCIRREQPPLPHIHLDILESGRISIARWRGMYRVLLSGARSVICPSIDSRRRLRKYFPAVRATVIPHEAGYECSSNHLAGGGGSSNALRIAVVGGISVEKGALVIADCASAALSAEEDIEFNIIGYSSILETLSLPNVRQTGPYKNKDLPAMIKKSEANCIFLPSVWPETYMYTLSHAVRTGLPVFVFNLGAQAERIISYPLGYRIPLGIAHKPRNLLRFILRRI